MDFAIALALISLLGATLLSNMLARSRERAPKFDAVANEALQLLMRERAMPEPMCPTLSPEHWARLEAALPQWRRETFAIARERYIEARATFSRNCIDGSLFYPEPALIIGATHQLLVLSERF